MSVSAPSSKTAIIFLSHLFSPSIQRRFKRLCTETSSDYDVFWLFDSTGSISPPSFKSDNLLTFDLDDLKRLNYPFVINNIINGNAHIPVILFSLTNFSIKLSYSAFWIVEYDVVFNGSWKTFFHNTEEDESDFLTAAIRSNVDQPHWPHWNTFVPPSNTNPQRLLASFNPIYRISRAALQHINEAHRAGCRGDYEVVIPTLLHDAGFEIADLDKDGTFGSSCLNTSLCIRDVTHCYRPPMLRPGPLRDMIYHPVKPASWFYRNYATLIKSLLGV